MIISCRRADRQDQPFLDRHLLREEASHEYAISSLPPPLFFTNSISSSRLCTAHPASHPEAPRVSFYTGVGRYPHLFEIVPFQFHFDVAKSGKVKRNILLGLVLLCLGHHQQERLGIKGRKKVIDATGRGFPSTALFFIRSITESVWISRCEHCAKRSA